MSIRRLIPHQLVDLARTGDRTIYSIPEWAGLANQLFFLLWGAEQQWADRDYFMVRSTRSETWLEHFPAMRDQLTIGRADVRFGDRRDRDPFRPMPGPSSHAATERFVGDYLMPSGLFDAAPGAADVLTAHIRRGDYYSDPQVRGLFSFDQIAYLGVVLDQLRNRGQDHFSRIDVVSDDLDWCRARLRFLGEYADELVFAAGDGPLGDLAKIGTARNLVLTNSTFSIWGAYISNYLHGDNHADIWAPAFGTRPFTGKPWDSVDRRWSIVEDIPGGWDS